VALFIKNRNKISFMSSSSNSSGGGNLRLCFANSALCGTCYISTYVPYLSALKELGGPAIAVRPRQSISEQ
jgi:hypothetical protein